MRPGAVVDTGVLVGAFHRRDAHHAEALSIVLAADDGKIPPLLLTDFVLAETINYLTRKGGSQAGREALDRLEASPGFSIERVPDTVYTRGKNEVYRAFEGLSFVDALTVAFMQARELLRLYSFDRGFDQVPKLKRLVRVAEGHD